MLNDLVLAISRETGQDLAEYGLVVTLIAVVAVAALTLMGTSIAVPLAQVAGSI